MTDPKEIWIIDSSSIIELKHVPNVYKDNIHKELERLIITGALVYPSQVVDELDDHDRFSELFRKHKRRAARHEPLFSQVAELLKNPQISRVLDHTKVGREEADPYLLTLAVHLKQAGAEVTLITEEKRDRPGKLSLSSACGILRIYCIPILPFLEQKGLYSPPSVF